MIDETTDTVQLYTHRDGEEVAVIRILESIPVSEIVGVAAILSENAAVTVTTSVLEIILSTSVSDMSTVGIVLSIVKVILSVPA